MPDSNRNRNRRKGSDNQPRTGEDRQGQTRYKKLPDNPKATEEAISTAGDSANGKYSRTGKRDEDIDNNQVRGGS